MDQNIKNQTKDEQTLKSKLTLEGKEDQLGVLIIRK